jgi:hypothetical protein
MRALYAILACAVLSWAHASNAEGVDLSGTWYVLVHYRDAASAHPDRERWEDRIWVFARESADLSWSEHPIVIFEDETGRFERASSGQSARTLRFWQPNPAQRADIADGLQVASRGARQKTLRGSDAEGWASKPARSTGSASALTYSEIWRVEFASELPVFERSDFMTGALSESLEGRTRYATESVREGGALLVGSYERDGTRRGTFRMMRSGAIEAPGRRR